MKKILLIGLDGGDLKILRSLISRNELKAFKELLEGGCCGKLKSTIPAITIPAWPAMFSGKNPGKLGAVGFSRLERDYSLHLFTSLDWKDDMIWTLLGEEGVKVGLVNVPGTNPVYEVNGFMISSDFGAFQTYPENLRVDIQLKPVEKYITYSQMLKAAKHNFEERAKAVIRLLKEREWDLFIWVIRITDVAMHWGTQKDIEKAYLLVDRYLEGVLNLAKKGGWNLFIVSDHGVRKVKKVFNVNTFLERIGYLKFEKTEEGKKHFFKVARFLFKLHMKPFLVAGYRLISRFTQGLSHLDPEALSVGIKWNETKAFTLTDTTSNFMGIWLNSKRNFDCGIISSDEEEDIKQELINRLMAFKDGGKPVVKQVWRKEELYPGASPYIPDLFIETEDGYAPDFRGYDEIIVPNKKYIHDPYGIFIAYGPDILQVKEELEGLRIIDVAPTIFHFMGFPIPSDVDGRVLKEIFKPSAEVAKREVVQKTYVLKSREARRISIAEEELIKTRLKDLGYLG